MTIVWSFSYNSFVKFHGKKFGSQYNMTVLYPIHIKQGVLKKDCTVVVDDSLTSISVEVQGRPLTAVSQRPESTNSGRKSQQSTSSARRPKTTGKIHHKLLWSLFHRTL